MLNRIKEVVPVSRHKLRLTFADDSVVIYDCAPLITADSIFNQIADDEVFRSIRVGKRGRFIKWSHAKHELELCAAALRIEPQEA